MGSSDFILKSTYLVDNLSGKSYNTVGKLTFFDQGD